MQQFMTSDDEGSDESDGKSRNSFDVPLLKKETMRLILRTHKKIEKASTRIRGAEEQYDKLRVAMDGSSSDEVDEKILQQLEHAPNVEQYKDEMSDLQQRLQKLNWLEGQFNNPPLKGKKQLTIDELEKLFPEGARVVEYVLELDINDDERLRLKKIDADANNKRAKAEKAVTTKEQGRQQHGGRLPYRRYYSEQRTEIRVSTIVMGGRYCALGNILSRAFCARTHQKSMYVGSRSGNKRRTTTFYRSRRNIAPGRTGGITPPDVPDRTSSFARTMRPQPKTTSSMPPRWPHSRASASDSR
jgi:hypothetical protein